MLLVRSPLKLLWMEWSEERTIVIHHYINSTVSSVQSVHDVVLVWWTPFTGNQGSYLDCGLERCFVTEDRSFQTHPQFQVFLFYGSNIDILDLPMPKVSDVSWALLHEESPKNVPFLSHEAALSLFNYTSTFSRYSDVPLTLQYLHSIDSLTSSKYFVPVKKKNELLKHLSPVLYIQSDCDTPLDRDAYVKQLMKFIDIDSYGACLNNKPLSPSLSNPMESMESEEFLSFVAQYKFTISFENAICEDYITEKLWRPLSVGSVPIYLGSPSVKDWLPNNSSVILAQDFKSPKELALFISYLNLNDSEYTKFLAHKNGTVTNAFLLSEMASRFWKSSEEAEFHFVNYFECEMCQKAHLLYQKKEPIKAASVREYNCSLPVSSVTGHVNNENPWVRLWHHGKCEAEVLKESVLNRNKTSDHVKFYGEVHRRLQLGFC